MGSQNSGTRSSHNIALCEGMIGPGDAPKGGRADYT
jgi:hypothetical protein